MVIAISGNHLIYHSTNTVGYFNVLSNSMNTYEQCKITRKIHNRRNSIGGYYLNKQEKYDACALTTFNGNNISPLLSNYSNLFKRNLDYLDNEKIYNCFNYKFDKPRIV